MRIEGNVAAGASISALTTEIQLTLLEACLDKANLPAARVDELGACLQRIVDAELDNLPLPGRGRTCDRWRTLSAVAAHDLGLVKLFEGHTDAIAILAELQANLRDSDGTWGMWAAEPPYARVTLTRLPGSKVALHGRKAWCSGARALSHALLTAWDDNGQQCLAAVPLHQPGVRVTQDGWQAVGMKSTDSVEVVFDRAQGIAVGDPGAYVNRPGFWHGGAGIAACWYGAAMALGESLRAQAARGNDAHLLAHLGAVDAALSQGAAVLRECAAWIDASPVDNAARQTLRARAVIESTVDSVIKHVGRASGAAPFCRNLRFARLMADLPVFIRQSHAERDLEALGKAAAEEQWGNWRL